MRAVRSQALREREMANLVDAVDSEVRRAKAERKEALRTQAGGGGQGQLGIAIGGDGEHVC